MENIKKHKGGAPKIKFDEKDWEILDGFIVWSDKASCALRLKCSEKTLSRRIEEKYKMSFDQLRDKRKGEIANLIFWLQVESAKKGNVTMQIWLGKQILGQKDKQEFSGDAANPVTIIYKPKQPDAGITDN